MNVNMFFFNQRKICYFVEKKFGHEWRHQILKQIAINDFRALSFYTWNNVSHFIVKVSIRCIYFISFGLTILSIIIILLSEIIFK